VWLDFFKTEEYYIHQSNSFYSSKSEKMSKRNRSGRRLSKKKKIRFWPKRRGNNSVLTYLRKITGKRN
jgi:hypothetical protein